jgi:hypothetical protein
MPVQPKPRKVGRPKLAKGEGKGKTVVVRLHADEFKKIAAAAKASKQTVSQWIRSTLHASLQG